LTDSPATQPVSNFVNHLCTYGRNTMIIPDYLSFGSSLLERMIGLTPQSYRLHDFVVRFQGNPTKINGSSYIRRALISDPTCLTINEVRVLRSPMVRRRRVAYSRALGSAYPGAIGSIIIWRSNATTYVHISTEFKFSLQRTCTGQNPDGPKRGRTSACQSHGPRP
jgi:hypothetical protein